jgi:hypothetical protein
MTLADLVGLSTTHDAEPALLPESLTSVFSSTTHAGRLAVGPEIWLTVAFAELKLDLRAALFPPHPVRLVLESLCGSVEVLLPAGTTVVDETRSIFASHKVSQGTGRTDGPVLHVEGWNACSDVKLLVGA